MSDETAEAPTTPEPRKRSRWRIAAIVAVVLLGLLGNLWYFCLTWYVLPTGSMAPTILGAHFLATCKRCQYRFPVAASPGDIGPGGDRVSVTCPLCGTGSPSILLTVQAEDVQDGDRFAVNKLAYRFSQPKRWDVTVFRYPRDESRSFVKRLLGLPGEEIKFDARGDVWIRAPGTDHFEIVRKPLEVQEGLWLPVYDSRFRDSSSRAWVSEDATRWETTIAPGGEELVARPGAGETFIHYAREIVDLFGYNKGWQQHKPVGDVRIRALVTPDSDATSIELATIDNERDLIAEIPVGTGGVARLRSGKRELASASLKPLAAGVATDVALAYADEWATLTVSGTVVLEWKDPDPLSPTLRSSAQLGCRGPGGARFTNIRIDRDVVYGRGGRSEFDPTSQEVAIPAGGYFCVGDNTANSQDSREFGFVRDRQLIGRAIFVLWPPRVLR